MSSSVKFIAQKILTSSANNMYLECLITFQGTLINMLKNKDPENIPVGPLKRL